MKNVGQKIQGLEKQLVESLKETGLVEHPHFYHKDIKDASEPLVLAYKVPEEYRRSSFDPFIEQFPFEKIFRMDFQAVLEVKSSYDPLTEVHQIRMSLVGRNQDPVDFKYRVLQTLNESISKYLRQRKN